MHGEGRALCVAGPGSGKTRVIALRAARLACEGRRNHVAGCEGGNGDTCGSGVVLTLSFNRHACEEMKERGENLLRRVGVPESAARFSTVHAYCYYLIRRRLEKRGEAPPAVLEQAETEDILKRLYRGITGTDASKDVLRELKRSVSETEKNFIERQTDAKSKRFYSIADDVAVLYAETKRRLGLIDFDDMLAEAVRILKSDAEFLRETRRAFLFTQVDEAQDLSAVQAEIIELISDGNIFYVADDDQSIYGFRGAEPDILRGLGARTVYMLERNYRSNSEIVEVASRFIRGNEGRFGKRLSAHKGAGGSVSLMRFADTEKQADFVVAKMLDCAAKGRSACVLYRNNASAVVVLTKLFFAEKKRKIDIRPRVGGERVKFGESGFTDAVAELIKCEEEAFLERKGPGVFPDIGTIYRRLVKSGAIGAVMAGIGAGRRHLYAAVLERAAAIITGKALSGDGFMELAAEIDAFETDEASLINLSTVHSAKGLEYDTVIVIDCVKGEFPSGEGKGENALREERRLMYVAMTRAKSELVIAYPSRCGNLVFEPGSFVRELEEECGY